MARSEERDIGAVVGFDDEELDGVEVETEIEGGVDVEVERWDSGVAA
jgi:hypothetical protein